MTPAGGRLIRKTFTRSVALAAQGAETCGLLRLLEQVARGRENRLLVLVYHRVVAREEISSVCPGLVSTTPEEFARQMDFLARSYQPISAEDALAASRGERTLPKRAVLVTFDDAYHDFAEEAWPILKARGIPATLFVPTGFPDQPQRAFWWDRLHRAIQSTNVHSIDSPFGPVRIETSAERLGAFRWLRERVKETPHHRAMDCVDEICDTLGNGSQTSRVLGWEALRALANDGATLGAHTRNHPLIDGISPEEVRAEVSGALADLRRETGTALPIFAYPAGRHNDEAVRAVAESGIELAFTTGSGVNDLGHADPLRLRRIHVGARITRSLLRAQLLGVRRPGWL